jgi:hypothetical protein
MIQKPCFAWLINKPSIGWLIPRTAKRNKAQQSATKRSFVSPLLALC